MCVIISTKVVWAVAKDANMAEKVRTASIIEWIWIHVVVVALMY